MITPIIRKPTPTMETIHADSKKRCAEATHKYLTTLDVIHRKKTHTSSISRRGRKKEKARKRKQFFPDDYRDNKKTHGDDKKLHAEETNQ